MSCHNFVSFSAKFVSFVLGFGFALGQLIYVSQLAPKGPALTSGQIDAGDVVLEVSDLVNRS